jgi:UDP-glucose 4-epimerase
MRMVHVAESRIVVTGGAGFIGSHLVESLLNNGASRVTVIDNLSRGRLSNFALFRDDDRLGFLEADIRDYDTVRGVMRGADLVFHLAAQSTVMGAARNLDYTFTTNVAGTYNVLKAAAEQSVKRIVFSSSREVYGEPLTLPVDESHPLMSINTYGATKVAGEALCRAFSRETGIETRILRIANAFGPRDIGRVIPSWIEQARAGNDLTVYGGDQVLDFIWVADVVDAMLRAADADIALPPINVASGTGTKILDLARRIGQLVGHSCEIKLVPRRSIEVTRFVGNPERMTQLLGLTPASDPLARLAAMIPPRATASAAVA